MFKYVKKGARKKIEKGKIKDLELYLEKHGESALDDLGVKDGVIKSELELNSIHSKIKEDVRQLRIDTESEKATGSVSEPTTETKKDMKDNSIVDQISEEIQAETKPKVDSDIPTSFSPINSQPLKERSYNTKDGGVDVGEIPEPEFKGKDFSDIVSEESESGQESGSNDKPDSPSNESEEKENIADKITNEAFNELPDKDKKIGAKQLVNTVLDAYEMLHELGKKFVKYPEEKLQDKIIKGEIDPTMEIPIDERGNSTNVVEFFQDFNESASEAISYDPEFGEKVRPAMERVFMKKGWGMTDEQYLLTEFGKDVAWKGLQVYNLKKTSNSMMNTFVTLQREKIKAIREANQGVNMSESVSPDSIRQEPRTERTEPRREQVEPIRQEDVHSEDDLQDDTTDIVEEITNSDD